jgi:hypothetical protein
MRHVTTAILSLTAALSVSLVTSSALAFRCGGRVIEAGDRIHEVRARCGEPASIVTSAEEHTTFAATGGSGGRFRSAIGGTAVTRTIAIETWIYDRGPSRAMVELRFRDGILVSITRLGRGVRRGAIEQPIHPRMTAWRRA